MRTHTHTHRQTAHTQRSMSHQHQHQHLLSSKMTLGHHARISSFRHTSCAESTVQALISMEGQGSRRIYHILLTATCQCPYFSLCLCNSIGHPSLMFIIISCQIILFLIFSTPTTHTIMTFLFLPVLIVIFVLMYVRISVLYVHMHMCLSSV